MSVRTLGCASSTFMMDSETEMEYLTVVTTCKSKRHVYRHTRTKAAVIFGVFVEFGVAKIRTAQLMMIDMFCFLLRLLRGEQKTAYKILTLQNKYL